MTAPNTEDHGGEITDVSVLWTRVERHGTDVLTDNELRILFRWCDEREIALPPASEVYHAMAVRMLVDLDGKEVPA